MILSRASRVWFTVVFCILPPGMIAFYSHFIAKYFRPRIAAQRVEIALFGPRSRAFFSITLSKIDLRDYGVDGNQRDTIADPDAFRWRTLQIDIERVRGNWTSFTWDRVSQELRLANGATDHVDLFDRSQLQNAFVQAGVDVGAPGFDHELSRLAAWVSDKDSRDGYYTEFRDCFAHQEHKRGETEWRYRDGDALAGWLVILALLVLWGYLAMLACSAIARSRVS